MIVGLRFYLYPLLHLKFSSPIPVISSGSTWDPRSLDCPSVFARTIPQVTETFFFFFGDLQYILIDFSMIIRSIVLMTISTAHLQLASHFNNHKNLKGYRTKINVEISRSSQLPPKLSSKFGIRLFCLFDAYSFTNRMNIVFIQI